VDNRVEGLAMNIGRLQLRVITSIYVIFFALGVSISLLSIVNGAGVNYVSAALSIGWILVLIGFVHGSNVGRIIILIHATSAAISSIVLSVFFMFWSRASFGSWILAAIWLIIVAPNAWCAYVLRFSQELRTELLMRDRSRNQKHQEWIELLEKEERQRSTAAE
jgi:hypothetical protein